MAEGYLSSSFDKVSGMDYEALLYSKTNIGGYFFDGVLSVNHQNDLEITENPVESGASISDHAYLKPRVLTMKVMVSDVHRSFIDGQFEGGYRRHVTAYDILCKLQSDRIPVSVCTKLKIYNNMLIQSIQASESEGDNYESLAASVVLKEIPVAQVKRVKISLADQTTIDTQAKRIQAEQATKTISSTLYNLFGGPGDDN